MALTDRKWILVAACSLAILPLAGCALPCAGGACSLCGPPNVREGFGLYPVPIRPVFGTSEPMTLEEDSLPPVPASPEIIPAPPPSESAKAAVPKGSKAAAKANPAAPADSKGPSWVFAPPVHQSLLRRMQPSVELKTDPAAKGTAQARP